MLEPLEWAWPLANPGPAPLGEPHHESHLEEELRNPTFWAHVTGLVAEYYELIHVTGEVLVAEAGGVAAAAAWLAPLGYVATVIVTAQELYKAFTLPEKIQAHHGYSQGLMLAALGLPDPPTPTTKGAPFGDGQVNLSEREREAWEEGVRSAREAVAKDPKLREQILRAVAYEMAVQKRDLSTDPQHVAWKQAVYRTLNRIYQSTNDENLKSGHLDWTGDQDGFPKPPPAQPAPNP